MTIRGGEDDYKPKVTILSIDGGGIRGVIPAHILAKLEAFINEEHKKKDARIAEYFDVIAGTSTGSILTALLTTPEDNNKDKPRNAASGFVDFYKQNGNKIFQRTWSLDFLKIKIKQYFHLCYQNTLKIVSQNNNKRLKPSSKIDVVHDYLELYCCLNDPKELQTEVDKQLKDIKLSQTVTKVVIPTFRLAKGMPVIFTSDLKEDDMSFGSEHITLKDAILSSSAAPLYFPPHIFKFRSGEGKIETEMFFDGGLATNNPTLAALCEATNKHGNEKDYSNYLVISIGTGQTRLMGPKSTTFSQWFYSQIKLNLVNFIMATVNDTVDFQMSRFFYKHPQNYLHIQKYDLTADEADLCNGDPKHVEKLENLAEKMLKEKVKVVHPYTGIMEDGEDTYEDALKEFARKLVEEKKKRDKAKEKVSGTIRIQ